METGTFVLLLALFLDRLIGDPAWLWSRFPHPVVWFGKAVEASDRRLNTPSGEAADLRRRGLLAVFLLVLAAALAGLILHFLLRRLGLTGFLLEAALAAVFLAQKSLLDHVRAVAAGLGEGLAPAREAVSRIVGRDTAELDHAGIGRAAVESAAEGFADGVVAPAFWFALLGLPGLFAYKMINTADSMIGHRSPRYLHFGRAAARLDDAANFLPARLSALFIAAGALAVRGVGAGRRALVLARRDAGLHRSPNAGWPEAAMAGALGLALGGPRRYGSVFVQEAHLNTAGQRCVGAGDIRAGLRVIEAAWAALAASVLVLAVVLS